MKKYICNSYRYFSILIKIGNSSRTIRFAPAHNMFNGSVYSAKSADEEKAIESTSVFKRGIITIDPTSISKEEEDIEDKNDDRRVHPKVKTWEGAINVLVKTYDVDKNNLNSVEDIKSAAKDLNVEFPNIEED